VSLWLNSGVPATEPARRAGHGVVVLLKMYAHRIDGQADAANPAGGSLYSLRAPTNPEFLFAELSSLFAGALRRINT
jgi:hypothetical protein